MANGSGDDRYAPSQGLLAVVAAGPIEDLFNLKELMRDEPELYELLTKIWGTPK